MKLNISKLVNKRQKSKMDVMDLEDFLSDIGAIDEKLTELYDMINDLNYRICRLEENDNETAN